MKDIHMNEINERGKMTRMWCSECKNELIWSRVGSDGGPETVVDPCCYCMYDEHSIGFSEGRAYDEKSTKCPKTEFQVSFWDLLRRIVDAIKR